MIADAVAATALRVSVAPERLRLGPGADGALTIRAQGPTGVDVTVDAAGYALDQHGRPVVRGAGTAWLHVAPRRLTLLPGRAAHVRVTAAVPRGSAAGDHPFVVLVSVADRARRASRVLVRVGVVTVVRVPGRLRRRLVVAGVAVTRTRRLRIVLANRGNVDEWLTRGRAVAVLRRGGRVAAVLRSPPRRLLAHGRTVFEWALPWRLRGPAVAWVTVGAPTPRRRAYRLRL